MDFYLWGRDSGIIWAARRVHEPGLFEIGIAHRRPWAFGLEAVPRHSCPFRLDDMIPSSSITPSETSALADLLRPALRLKDILMHDTLKLGDGTVIRVTRVYDLISICLRSDRLLLDVETCTELIQRLRFLTVGSRFGSCAC